MIIQTDRYNISAMMYLPKEKIKKIIIACHGFGGDKESSAIQLLAQKMVENGVGVICFDFPGHGESEVDADKLTIENCIDDINSIENYVAENYPNIPISIFSTSFGAYITLLNIARNNKKYENIILRSPAIQMGEIYLNALLRESEEDYKKRGYTKLGFGREMLVPYSFLHELEDNNIMEIYKNINMPEIHIIQGDKDDIAPIKDTIKFMELSSNVDLYIIEGADHRMKGEGELEKAIEHAKKIIL